MLQFITKNPHIYLELWWHIYVFGLFGVDYLQNKRRFSYDK